MACKVTDIKRVEVRMTDKDLIDLLKSKHEDMVVPPGWKGDFTVQAESVDETLENITGLVITMFMSRKGG
jgi:hypothetical protein